MRRRRTNGERKEGPAIESVFASAPKSRWRQVFTAVLIVVSLGFVAAQIVDGWPQLASAQWRISPGLGALSLLLLLVNFALFAASWTVALKDLGQPATYLRTIAVLYVAQPGRYVPGKVWLVLGQLNAAQRFGISKTSVIAAGFMQLAAGACGGLAVLSAAAAVAHESPVIVYGALALSAAAAVTLLAAPSWVEWGIARLRARWGLPAVEIAVHRSATAKFIGLAIVAWIVHCTAFVALAASLASFDLPTASRLAFAYNLAYHVAFFVFIVPGGIGVREGTLTALIAPALGSAAAGVLALVQRFWYMAAELLSFLVALALLRWLAPANSAGTDRANS